MKIRIIGSMKFHDKYQEIKDRLKGKHEVIIPLADEEYSNEDNPKRKSMEDFNNDLENSDAILVANYDKDDKPNYIGVNLIMEVGMAFNREKKIFILNKTPENCKEEFEAIGVITLNGNLEDIENA